MCHHGRRRGGSGHFFRVKEVSPRLHLRGHHSNSPRLNGPDGPCTFSLLSRSPFVVGCRLAAGEKYSFLVGDRIGSVSLYGESETFGVVAAADSDSSFTEGGEGSDEDDGFLWGIVIGSVAGKVPPILELCFLQRCMPTHSECSSSSGWRNDFRCIAACFDYSVFDGWVPRKCTHLSP